jgi:hypothetical protein
LPEAFDSDPSHEAGERGEATLLRMRRDPRQFEDFVGHRWIQFRWGNHGPSGRSGLREPLAQRLEPGVHLAANRITNDNFG